MIVYFKVVDNRSQIRSAEEGGAGKVKLLEAGAFKGMDICLMYGLLEFISLS